MHASEVHYHHDDQELHAYVTFNENIQEPKPAVLVVHDWTGRNDFACEKAKLLAEMGYVGFAIDMYGKAKLGTNNDEKMALMHPLVSNREFLKKRMHAAYNAVLAMPEVDSSRIAVIGFCFGGLCALDLARSGAAIRGAVSFHGLLGKPEQTVSDEIRAKILVLHGYDDPMVQPEQLIAFCDEMNQAKADWQVHMYGRVQHAFTNPLAHDASLGLFYNESAAKRSWQAMRDFLQEIFQ